MKTKENTKNRLKYINKIIQHRNIEQRWTRYTAEKKKTHSKRQGSEKTPFENTREQVQLLVVTYKMGYALWLEILLLLFSL